MTHASPRRPRKGPRGPILVQGFTPGGRNRVRLDGLAIAASIGWSGQKGVLYSQLQFAPLDPRRGVQLLSEGH